MSEEQVQQTHLEEQKLLHEMIESYIETDDRPSLAALLAEQRESDIAEVVEILNDHQRHTVFTLLDKPTAAEVINRVDEATRRDIFDEFRQDQIAEFIVELPADDAADILSELSEEQADEILENINATDAIQIKTLLKYTEDSAGGIMDPLVLKVYEHDTVKEAVEKIRDAEIDEDFYSVFVVNQNGQYLGHVRIRLLLTAKEQTQIKQLIDSDSIFVTTDTDQEEVRNIFKKNDLIVVPVLAENNVLVGRITADRIIEVAEEEAAEDLYTMAGTDAAELEKISILHAARVRMTWLLPCLAGTAVTALVLMLFQKQFKSFNLAAMYGTVVAFVPMIMAISGNAGLQTSAIVVCGLATGDLAAFKLRQVFMREVRVALLVALGCGIIGGFLCAFMINSDLPGQVGVQVQNVQKIGTTQVMRLVGAFSVSMFSAIMVATTLGLFLPFLFRKVGIDPAISSGPLVTTANDSISVAIYLLLALLMVNL